VIDVDDQTSSFHPFSRFKLRMYLDASPTAQSAEQHKSSAGAFAT
jgi:hypothetical protein